MLNSEDLIAKIAGLIAEDGVEPEEKVSGLGICTDTVIDYSKEKLEESKGEIASILHELGIDERAMITLHDLMRLKNGEYWNNLQSIEDFRALELLLSCASACGFIINNENNVKNNKNQLDITLSSALISGTCRDNHLPNKSDEWLNFIKKYVIDYMYFLIVQPEIKKYTEDDTNKVIR